MKNVTIEDQNSEYMVSIGIVPEKGDGHDSSPQKAPSKMAAPSTSQNQNQGCRTCKALKYPETYMALPGPAADVFDHAGWRKKCGCLKTSEKLKRILEQFPQTPPPTPNYVNQMQLQGQLCNSKFCSVIPAYMSCPDYSKHTQSDKGEQPQKATSRTQAILGDLVRVIQITVTATALALYYLIYCYMQLLYYTLSSLMYFLRADVPMKITIAVVTVTSLVVGFHLLLRIEKLIGLRY